MTDKEKIIAEIERRRVKYKELISKSFGVEQEYFKGMAVVADEMMLFINSLPAEQPSEDLEKAATALTNEIVGELNLGDYTDHSGHNAHWHSFKEGVIAGAQWQKEQMMKSAIDATCVILPPPDLFKVLICHEVTDKLADKQKIKILIVKEDKQ